MSKIEWTEQTWNPIVGCSIVSPGCTNCYAMKMAARLEAIGFAESPYAGTTQPSKAGPVWTSKVAMASERALLAPLKRKKSTTYFVNSMGDLFHEDVPDAWIDRVFAVMALTPQHTYQVLTKRSARMRAYMTDPERKRTIYLTVMDVADAMARAAGSYKARPLIDDVMDIFRGAGPFPNVWLGVSAERQQEADARIPDLLQTPAAVRFVSAEPLLGPIDFTRWSGREGYPDFGIDWIIVGGESGPSARPMHPDWARSIRDQCAAADVAFFFKQWGAWADCTADPTQSGNAETYIFSAAGETFGAGWRDMGSVDPDWDKRGGAWMASLGKSRAGRLLDGREHNDMPQRVREAA